MRNVGEWMAALGELWRLGGCSALQNAHEDSLESKRD